MSEGVKKENSARKEFSGKKRGRHKAVRIEPVSGCAYSAEMSDAYWKGMKDGEKMASHMVCRAEPKNVRVRSLATVTEGSGTGLETAATQAIEVKQPENTGIEVCENIGKSSEISVKKDETTYEKTLQFVNMNENKTEIENSGVYSVKGCDIVRDEPVVSRPPEKPEKKTETKTAAYIGAVYPAEKKPEKKPEQKKSPITAERKEEKKKTFIQPWKEISFLRKVFLVAGAGIFLFAFSPLLVGVTTIGMLPIALIGLFVAGCALLWNHVEDCRSALLRLVFMIVGGAVILGILGMAFISGKMLGASLNTVPEDKERVTVVVLGCLVKGDQPSLMLQKRLDTAAEYLRQHPEAYCVVTGGQGADEEYPEAVVMKRYLVDAGISKDRIIAEKKSTSTVENLQFAKEYIDKYNCHEDVVIVSDRFHQYRARLAAEMAGLRSYALPCETRWELAAQYWFREMACIVRDWLKSW